MPVLNALILDRCHHVWSTVSSNRAPLLLSEFTMPTVYDRLPAGPLRLQALPSCPSSLVAAARLCHLCWHVLPNNAFSTYHKLGIVVFRALMRPVLLVLLK